MKEPLPTRPPRSAFAPIPGAAGLAAFAVGAAVLAALVYAPAVISPYGVEIGFSLLLYMTLAEAWNLLAGYGGLVSLGSSAFIGTGAYVLTGLLNHSGTPLLLAILAAGLNAAAVAAVVSPAVFRLRGLYFTVGTLALGEAARLFMINVPFFGGATGLFLEVSPPATAELYPYLVGLLALATIIMTVYTRTRFSIVLRSVRDDEDAAAQVGVRAFRVKFAVFTIASFLMGAAGGLQAFKLGAIEPYGMFGLQWAVNVFAIVIIGGLGQRAGAIVGSIFVVALNEALADYPEIHTAITGVILIAVIRFAPRGLCGLADDLVRRFRPGLRLGAPAPGTGAP
jgi:branched-chain amino acid transport system permease protein